jgi:uncharacterized membrane protein
MSSSTRPPDADAPRGTLAGHAPWLRLVLVAAYLLFSHLAGQPHGDGRIAALALADLALIVLLRPLLERHAGAWLLLVAIVAALAWLVPAAGVHAALLLVPAAIIGAVAWSFARTLPSVPLITRMVAGLDRIPATQLAPDLQRYTRNLTRSWALLLGVLALLNLLLALLRVPDGLLATLGIAPPFALAQPWWSWAAGVFNLVSMVGFFLAEFAVRQRRFPGRYRNLADFLRQMGELGPAFWRDVTR